MIQRILMLPQSVRDHERRGDALRGRDDRCQHDDPVILPRSATDEDIGHDTEAGEQDRGHHQDPGRDVDQRAMIRGGDLGVSMTGRRHRSALLIDAVEREFRELWMEPVRL